MTNKIDVSCTDIGLQIQDRRASRGNDTLYIVAHGYGITKEEVIVYYYLYTNRLQLQLKQLSCMNYAKLVYWTRAEADLCFPGHSLICVSHFQLTCMFVKSHTTIWTWETCARFFGLF